MAAVLNHRSWLSELRIAAGRSLTASSSISRVGELFSKWAAIQPEPLITALPGHDAA